MWVSSLVLLLLLLFLRTSLACQAGCQCSTGGTVVCSNAGLRTFPILLDPRTTRLDLSNNQLTRFTADDLSVYPSESVYPGSSCPLSGPISSAHNRFTTVITAQYSHRIERAIGKEGIIPRLGQWPLIIGLEGKSRRPLSRQSGH